MIIISSDNNKSHDNNHNCNHSDLHYKHDSNHTNLTTRNTTTTAIMKLSQSQSPP